MPRPILLVKDDGTNGPSLHPEVASLFRREGYLVIYTPAERMKDFRVLTPNPFTEIDVRLVRESADVFMDEKGGALNSIADRMEAML